MNKIQHYFFYVIYTLLIDDNMIHANTILYNEKY